MTENMPEPGAPEQPPIPPEVKPAPPSKEGAESPTGGDAPQEAPPPIYGGLGEDLGPIGPGGMPDFGTSPAGVEPEVDMPEAGPADGLPEAPPTMSPEEKAKYDESKAVLLNKESSTDDVIKAGEVVGIPKGEMGDFLRRRGHDEAKIQEILAKLPEDVQEPEDEDNNPLPEEESKDGQDLLKKMKNAADKGEIDQNEFDNLKDEVHEHMDKVKKTKEKGKLGKIFFDEETGHLRKGNKLKASFRFAVYTTGIMLLMYLTLLAAVTKKTAVRVGGGH